jgi:CRISPR/Cas system-associated exonuclease Cas4 (RecB family)
VTASDLAEYAYCPRAYWYRRHPPPEGPTPSSSEARAGGERHHARALMTRYRRERWSAVWWVLVAVGLLLFLLALVEFGAFG